MTGRLFVVALVSVVFGAGCWPPSFDEGFACTSQGLCPPEQRCGADRRCRKRPLRVDDLKLFPVPEPNSVISLGQIDILFVIDNSGSMVQEQAALARGIGQLVARLRDPQGQPLDYRIAVTSTDIGVSGILVDPSPFNLCNSPSSLDNAGRLSHAPHVDPADWEASNAGLFACGDPGLGIVGSDPQFCDDLKAQRQWLVDSCGDSIASADTPWIANDAQTNLPDEEVARRFRCIALLGVNGCFIEQPLEAARRALLGNPSFLRPDAYLAVIFMTDEIDCSLKDYALIDPNDRNFDSPDDVGFRCYRDAQRLGGHTTLSARNGGDEITYHLYTEVSDDPKWLIPVQDYIDFFTKEIKGEAGGRRVVLSGIIGNVDYTDAPPAPNGPGPLDPSIRFVWEDHLSAAGSAQGAANSCASINGGAAPNRRIYELLKAFPDPSTQQPTAASICSSDLSPALSNQIGTRISLAFNICTGISTATPDGCELLEVGGDQSTRSITPYGTGWSLELDSPDCTGITLNDTARLTIEEELLATFAADSRLAIYCPPLDSVRPR